MWFSRIKFFIVKYNLDFLTIFSMDNQIIQKNYNMESLSLEIHSDP